MARRVTWTNNSTDYDGTNIYRDTTIDPQNLPEPIATVDPAAQGATVEYIDLTGSGDQCYAVRDFDSSGDGALSEAYCFEETTDWSQVSIGDEVEGGIYAGTITYADAREFHIVAAKASGEVYGLVWGADGVVTGATDVDDGKANQELVLGSFDDGTLDGFYHCRDYTSGGFDDWYMPSKNESQLIMDNLVSSGHPEFAIGDTEWRLVSREHSSSNINIATWNSLTVFDNGAGKDFSDAYTRPIRRVPV